MTDIQKDQVDYYISHVDHYISHAFDEIMVARRTTSDSTDRAECRENFTRDIIRAIELMIYRLTDNTSGF